jgi:hypothetical protein
MMPLAAARTCPDKTANIIGSHHQFPPVFFLMRSSAGFRKNHTRIFYYLEALKYKGNK